MKFTQLALASVMLVVSIGLAVAQAPAPSAGGGRFAACRDDMQKFCSDKTGPARRQCMQDNRDKLSDVCKAALAAARPAPAGQ